MNEQELKAMGQITRDLPERLAYAKALEDLQQLDEEYRFWSGEALREVERLDDVIYEAEQRRRRLREDLSTMSSLWQEPQTSKKRGRGGRTVDGAGPDDYWRMWFRLAC